MNISINSKNVFITGKIHNHTSSNKSSHSFVYCNNTLSKVNYNNAQSDSISFSGLNINKLEKKLIHKMVESTGIINKCKKSFNSLKKIMGNTLKKQIPLSKSKKTPAILKKPLITGIDARWPSVNEMDIEFKKQKIDKIKEEMANNTKERILQGDNTELRNSLVDHNMHGTQQTLGNFKEKLVQSKDPYISSLDKEYLLNTVPSHEQIQLQISNRIDQINDQRLKDMFIEFKEHPSVANSIELNEAIDESILSYSEKLEMKKNISEHIPAFRGGVTDIETIDIDGIDNLPTIQSIDPSSILNLETLQESLKEHVDDVVEFAWKTIKEIILD